MNKKYLIRWCYVNNEIKLSNLKFVFWEIQNPKNNFKIIILAKYKDILKHKIKKKKDEEKIENNK
jgi:hypothetical protein